MNNREMLLEEFHKVPENTLIIVGKLYREKFTDQLSEAAFTQMLSRLCKSGAIERVSKGIYCHPKKTRFGAVLPSDWEIVEQFTAKNNGVLVGYGLYNSLGITTQIPKRLTAYSSASEGQLKQIGNVTIHKYDLDYSEETKAVIRMMELLHHHRDIQDINYAALLRSTEKLSKQYNEEAFDAVQKTIGYPKWTVAFLREALDYYHIPNHLSKYLSALSTYRIPRMEELYDAARNQN